MSHRTETTLTAHYTTSTAKGIFLSMHFYFENIQYMCVKYNVKRFVFVRQEQQQTNDTYAHCLLIFILYSSVFATAVRGFCKVDMQ